MKFLVIEYDYARKELEGAKLGNSKLLVNEDGIYLLLTICRNVEVRKHENKLFIDINEDSVDCLLIDYNKQKAVMFSVKHDIRKVRINYRRIRKSIQKKMRTPIVCKRLLAKELEEENSKLKDKIRRALEALRD